MTRSLAIAFLLLFSCARGDVPPERLDVSLIHTAECSASCGAPSPEPAAQPASKALTRIMHAARASATALRKITPPKPHPWRHYRFRDVSPPPPATYALE